MSFPDYLQTQPLLRIATTLMLGIIVGDHVASSLSIWILLVTILACMVVELLLKDKPYAKSLMILLAVFLSGAAIVIYAEDGCSFPFNNDIPIKYEAVVKGEPQIKGKVLKCDILVTKIESKELAKPVSVKATILRDTVFNNWKTLRIGSGIKAISVMQDFEEMRKDGNFDYARWLRCHGFRAQTFIFYNNWQLSNVNLSPLSKFERLRLRALKYRSILVNKLKLDDANNDQQSAVVAAMVLGDKHTISKKTKDEYSVSGASHVLALSGLHLGIIYTILTLLFGKGFRFRWLSQALIIVAIWCYVVIVGMGTSVIRSAVMLTIYSLCFVAGRDKASINTLSLAAIVMLIFNPLCLWDIGFQMSFMAVLSIVVFYKKVYELIPKRGNLFRIEMLNRIIKILWGTAVVSIVAQIGTAPLIAYYFGRFSCYFLLTNYIVVPCTTIIIYGVIAVLATTQFSMINIFLTHWLTNISFFLNSSVSFIASLPGACIDNIHINTTQVFCYYALIAIVCIILSYLKGLRPLRELDVFK